MEANALKTDSYLQIQKLCFPPHFNSLLETETRTATPLHTIITYFSNNSKLLGLLQYSHIQTIYLRA